MLLNMQRSFWKEQKSKMDEDSQYQRHAFALTQRSQRSDINFPNKFSMDDMKYFLEDLMANAITILFF